MSADGVDLSPRSVAQLRRRPKWLAVGLVAAIAVVIAVLIWVLISNSQAFLEADIAVTEREEQGDKRFQLLGSPIADADRGDTIVIGSDEFTPFTIAFDGVKVDVLSEGAPPDLFDAGVPVVLEGAWVQGPAPTGVSWPDGANDGWYFSTDRILVKHDNDYRQERIDDADERGRVDAAANG